MFHLQMFPTLSSPMPVACGVRHGRELMPEVTPGIDPEAVPLPVHTQLGGKGGGWPGPR